jgi:hypothetical protein
MDSQIQVLEGLMGAPLMTEEVSGYGNLAAINGIDGTFTDVLTTVKANKWLVLALLGGVGFFLYRSGKLPFLRPHAGAAVARFQQSVQGLSGYRRRRKSKRSRRRSRR